MERDLSNLSKEELGLEIKYKLAALLEKKKMQPSKLTDFCTLGYTPIRRWFSDRSPRNITLLDAAQISEHLGMETPMDLLLEPKVFVKKYQLDMEVTITEVKTVSISELFFGNES